MNEGYAEFYPEAKPARGAIDIGKNSSLFVGLDARGGAASVLRRTLHFRVIHVISTVHKRLPLVSQHQTYRCTALNDVKGHEPT